MDEDKPNWGLFGARRGRPAKPPANPLGEYLRRLREERGWTIRQLAGEIGMPESSAGYLSQLESGTKVPSPEAAERLAQRLGDRRGVFRLWSMIGRRADPHRAASARRALAHIFDDPILMHDERFTPPERVRLERADWQELPPPAFRSAAELPANMDAPPLDTTGARDRWHGEELDEWDASRPRLAAREPLPAGTRTSGSHAVRVPLLPEGTDPRLVLEYLHARGTEFVRLDPEALATLRLERPFAYRLSAEGAHRVRHVLREGDIAVMTCDVHPIVRQEIYGVRVGRRVVLGNVIWNGAELLLLPAPEDSDFVVLHPRSRDLDDAVVARLATVVRGSAASTRPRDVI